MYTLAAIDKVLYHTCSSPESNMRREGIIRGEGGCACLWVAVHDL